MIRNIILSGFVLLAVLMILKPDIFSNPLDVDVFETAVSDTENTYVREHAQSLEYLQSKSLIEAELKECRLQLGAMPSAVEGGITPKDAKRFDEVQRLSDQIATTIPPELLPQLVEEAGSPPALSAPEPVVSEAKLLSFASNSILCLHNISFLRYARELKCCSGAFTPAGWKSFEKSVIKAGFLSLWDEKAVSSAVATSPPVVVIETVHQGRRVWLIRMNIVVRVDAGGASRTQTNEVTVVVMRMPMTEHAEGLAISQYRAEHLTI